MAKKKESKKKVPVFKFPVAKRGAYGTYMFIERGDDPVPGLEDGAIVEYDDDTWEENEDWDCEHPVKDPHPEGEQCLDPENCLRHKSKVYIIAPGVGERECYLYQLVDLEKFTDVMWKISALAYEAGLFVWSQSE